MATIRKRGSRFQVQVRRQGQPIQSRTFLQLKDAQAWARQMEVQADRHDLPPAYHAGRSSDPLSGYGDRPQA